MKTKTTRQIDAQGRISLPGYIRNEMKLGPGNIVSVEIDDEGVVHIKSAAERCCICDKDMDDASAKIEIGSDKKICYDCALAIVQATLTK
ncbi:MAG: AbrB/MazE/SpoVT family DNA-binding domain-containing protein [Faecousia sp.]